MITVIVVRLECMGYPESWRWRISGMGSLLISFQQGRTQYRLLPFTMTFLRRR